MSRISSRYTTYTINTDEVAHAIPLLGQIGHQCRFSTSRFAHNNEMAAMFICDKFLNLFYEPLSPNKRCGIESRLNCVLRCGDQTECFSHRTAPAYQAWFEH